MVKSAAIYCRISKDANGQGLGVARQEDLCRKLAKEKSWSIAGVYTDNDMSAYAGARRPEYERMLGDLEAGLVDAVLVVDQDRLTRQPRELEDFIILADRLGVPIANVSGEIDLSTSDGRFRARIMGAVARQESEKKSERIRRQKDQAATQGRAHGGRRRYGYIHSRTADGHATLTIVPAEATRIREAAQRLLAGESLRSIVVSWNRQGIPTATGSEWRVTTLRTMLTGPHIVGLRVHHGEIVGAGDWPAVLDRATWERIRAFLGDPRRRRGGRRSVHLLTGLLECSFCGARLHHTKRADTGTGRYVCSPTAGSPSCGKIAVAAEAAERIVTDLVLHALATIELFDAVSAVPESDTSRTIALLEEAEAALERLAVDHYVERRITAREYQAARSALADRIMELTDLFTVVPAPAPVGLPSSHADLVDLWGHATTEERRAILRAAVERVVVKPGVQGRRTVDPSRFQLEWKA